MQIFPFENPGDYNVSNLGFDVAWALNKPLTPEYGRIEVN